MRLRWYVASSAMSSGSWWPRTSGTSSKYTGNSTLRSSSAMAISRRTQSMHDEGERDGGEVPGQEVQDLDGHADGESAQLVVFAHEARLVRPGWTT